MATVAKNPDLIKQFVIVWGGVTKFQAVKIISIES